MENTQMQEQKAIQITNEPIFEIQRSESEVVRISYCTPAGKGKSPYIDHRVYFLSKKTGDYLPTKKGFTLKVDLAESLAKAYSMVEEFTKAKK